MNVEYAKNLEYMKRWRQRNKERLRLKRQEPERKKARRIQALRQYAKLHGFEIRENVDFDVVYERDKGICQICFEPVDLSVQTQSPMSATIDHIEPVHSYATVQLAHHICNNRRR